MFALVEQRDAESFEPWRWVDERDEDLVSLFVWEAKPDQVVVERVAQPCGGWLRDVEPQPFGAVGCHLYILDEHASADPQMSGGGIGYLLNRTNSSRSKHHFGGVHTSTSNVQDSDTSRCSSQTRC